MQTKSHLQAADVNRILAAATNEAQANKWAVAIAVVDAGGILMGMTRLDGVAPISAFICQEKAKTAALGCRESKIYEDVINGGRMSFLSAPQLQGMLEGGVNIVVDGHTVGAVGVSGVKSTEDTQIAKAGIAAL